MYNIIIYLYSFGAWVLSFFDKKVKKMIEGQRQTAEILQKGNLPQDSVVWFHAASLGEFEQGRPLMERLRREHPEYKILLTFFSPSGYEVRKNYEGADVICYLPFDTPGRVHRFLKLAHPEIALFIKYEFWQNYLTQMHHSGVRVYSISSIFREKQHFFRFGGNPKPLRQFNQLFVQNEKSKNLLATVGVNNVTIVGDTRFDRVIDICRQAADIPEVEAFVKDGSPVFICGSSWQPDEEIYIPYFASHKDWKLIIAPHVVSDENLSRLEQLLKDNGMDCVRFSSLTGKSSTAVNSRVLVVDCYGKLASIYRYATVAAVGGGFGVGIHNVPEAAVYGVPVLFGPNNKKFREAQALLREGGAVEYTDAASFAQTMDKFIADKDALAKAGRIAGDYISNNAGASDKCYKAIFAG